MEISYKVKDMSGLERKISTVSPNGVTDVKFIFLLSTTKKETKYVTQQFTGIGKQTTQDSWFLREGQYMFLKINCLLPQVSIPTYRERKLKAWQAVHLNWGGRVHNLKEIQRAKTHRAQ